jgi:hypothetical protein
MDEIEFTKLKIIAYELEQIDIRFEQLERIYGN